MPNPHAQPLRNETARTFEESLQELREEFRRGAAERLIDLRAKLTRISLEPTDRQALELASRHFHALSGSGASFGFAETSEAGREGESACLRLLSRPEAVSRQGLDGLFVIEGRIRSSLGLSPSPSEG